MSLNGPAIHKLAWHRTKSSVGNGDCAEAGHGRQSGSTSEKTDNAVPHVQTLDGYGPPRKSGPTQWIDVFNWHLWRATRRGGWRYLALICVVAVSTGFLMFAAGAAVAVVFLGLHIWMACGIGAGGVIA